MQPALFGRLFRLPHRSTPRHSRRSAKKIALLLGTVFLAANCTLALAATMTIDSYPSPAVAGEKLRYHVKVLGSTGKPCTNVTISLNLPAGVTFNSSWPGGSHIGNQVQWSLARLHSNNSPVDRWAEVTVDPGATVGSSLSASGSLSGSGCSAQTGSTTTVDPGGLPNLALSKSASRDHVSAGSQFTYTINYSNSGNAPATNVVIEDALPANTTFSSATGNGVHAGGNVTWNLGSVAAGANGSVTLTVDVDSPLANGTVLQNTAKMTSTELPEVSSQTVDVTVDSAPVLRVSKSTSSTHVTPGDTLQYTLHYENVGTDRATGIVIQDTLPADVTFLNASPAATENNGVVTINAGALDAGTSGQAFVSVQVNSPLVNQTVLENLVSISSNETAEVDGPQTDVTVTSTPELTLTKTASRATVPAGEQVVYTLHYENIGSDQATNVVLEDVLPAESQFVSATGNGNFSSGQVTWNLGSLAAGASGSVNLTVEAFDPITNGTVLHNTATLSAAELQQPATAFVNVTASSEPHLIIDKRVSSQTASPGDELVYTIRYGNSGSDVATGVTLEDHLPANVTFVSASGGGMEAGGIVDWSLPDLQPNATGSVSLTVKVNSPLADGLVLHNSATVDSVETSPVSAVVANSDVTVSSKPDWSFFKAATATQVQAGQQVVFFIQAENTGTSEATAVVIEDTLPTGLTLVSTQPSATVSGQTLSWNFASWAPATKKFFKVTAQVDSPQANGTRLENIAAISSNETGSKTGSAAITVSSTATLEIEKNVSRNTASPGDTLIYTISYRNSGTDQATGVLLEDHLPADVTFVSASGTGVENQGIVDWNLGTLAAGASGSVTVTVTVNSPLADGTVLHNAATLDSTETAPVSAAVTPSNVTISSSPKLGLTKSVSSRQAKPGDTLVYTLNYRNSGSDTATGVVLEDHLPANVTFVSASSGASENGGIVVWNLADLPAGASSASSITVTVNSPLPDGTRINNTATISSNETGPVQALVSVSGVTVNSAPSYLLSKSVSKKTASPGDTLVYTLNYSNTGTDIGTGVTLTDTLPPGVTFVSASGGGTHANGLVTWPATDLQAGASGSVSLTVQVNNPLPNGTVLTNSANLKDGTRGSIGITDTTITSAPLLDISKTASRTTVRPGDQLVYYVNVSNSGTDAASGVTIEDHLPPEVTFVSASGGGMHANGVVTWTSGSLDAGFNSPLSVTVLVNSPLADGTVLHNSATIDSNETAPQSSGVVDVTVESAPSYLMSKKVSRKTASPGDTLVYTLTYSNTGTDIGSGVTLTDTLPPGVTFVSASGSATHANGLVTWPATDLQAGASGSVSLTVQIDSPLPNGTVLTNTANLTDGTRGSIGITDTTITSAPVLDISKTASRTLVNAGDTLSYTIDFNNSGTDIATGVIIEDHLPPEVTFVSASDNGMFANGVVTWTIGDKPAGTSGSVSISVQVNTPLPNGTILHNSASVTSNETAPVSSGTVDVTVSSAPSLGIVKSANRTTVDAGGQVAYTLDFANIGTDTATGVVIEDHIPTDSSLVSASTGGVFSNGVVSWNVGDLPAGGSGSVSLTIQANSPLSNGTVLHNTGSIGSNETLAVSSNLVDVTVSSAPVLSVSKLASQPLVNAGGSLTYTIEYGNSGTDAASGLVLEDHLPPEVTFVSASGSATHSSGVVTWQLGTLPSGGTGSVTLTVDVNSPLADGTVLHNHVTLTSNETAPVSPPTTDVVVSSAPILTFAKSASTASVNAGAQLSYLFDFANTGTDNATSVVITDTLPPDTTFVNAGSGGVFDGVSNTVTWNLGTVAANTSGSVTLTVAVNSPLADGTVLNNQASINSTETPPAASAASVTVSSSPQLVLSKVPDPATFIEAGQNLAYNLMLSNTGTDQAANIVVTDQLPAGATPVAIGGVGSYDPASGTITWSVASLQAGQSLAITYTITVPLDLPNGSFFNNSVSAVAGNAPQVTAQSSVMVDSRALLQLSKSGSNSVEAGTTARYVIDYYNAGNLTASNVVLKDTYPSGTSFVSASDGGADGGGEVTWNLGSIPPLSGGSVEVTLMADLGLLDGTVLVNTASIAAANSTAVSASASTVVRSHVELQQTIAGAPDPVQAGAQVTFTVVTENIGNEIATSAEVRATLPANTQFISASAGGTFNAATGEIVWTPGTIAALDRFETAFVAEVNSPLTNGTLLTSNSNASSAESQPVSAQATVTVSSAPLLLLGKTVVTGTDTPENTVLYEISIQNQGNQDATGVVITDVLPNGLLAETVSGGGQIAPDHKSVTWDLGTVAAMAAPVELQLLARAWTEVGGEFVNTATASSTESPDVSASATIDLQIAPYQEIPTLDRHGLALLVLLLMGLGYYGLRRIV